jgi:hypothetical protein
MNYICKTPIVFVFFNRLDTMTRVLERIRQVKPSKLYFISDGPRNEEERKIVNHCRQTAEEMVDWDCELIKDYADANMTCKYRVYSGITYALEHEEKVIILEDDVLPSISFFRFMDEMLEKYASNKEIMMVSGYNALGDIYHIENDYLFSGFPSIWGWGTWRSAWEKMDIDMSDWPERRKNFKVNPWCLRYSLKQQFDSVYYRGLCSWGYVWRYSMLNNNGIGVTPAKTLIQNIGFGKDATHTKKNGKFPILKENELKFPLRQPNEICQDLNYDELYIQHMFRKGIFIYMIKYRIKKILVALRFKDYEGI